MIKTTSPARRLPLDPDVWIFFPYPAALAIIGFLFAWPWVWIPLLALSLAIVCFFRDPPRRTPKIPGAIVSPADGKICAIRANEDPEAGPVGGPCITIFLSVLNVHVNRSPYDGRVAAIRHQPGEFLNALNEASSARNECNWIRLECGGRRLTVRQIAGKIARRIVCRVREGQSLRRGQRLGLIRFGSRTELYLPPEARIQVEVGQVVKGGLTIMAFLPEE